MKRIFMSLVVLLSMGFATSAALASGGSQGEHWHKGDNPANPTQGVKMGY